VISHKDQTEINPKVDD